MSVYTTPITRLMPAEWRTTVTVRRPGGVDEYGFPVDPTEHEVEDCLISTQQSVEEAQTRSDSPDTTAWLYGPTGADFTSVDTIVIPESPYWPSGTFAVTGKPSKTPLGTRVPLREEG